MCEKLFIRKFIIFQNINHALKKGYYFDFEFKFRVKCVYRNIYIMVRVLVFHNFLTKIMFSGYF